MTVFRPLAQIALFVAGCGLMLVMGDAHAYDRSKLLFFTGCVVACVDIHLSFWVGGYRKL